MRHTRNINNEVGCSGQSHYLASERDGKDFSAIEPGCAVKHAVWTRVNVSYFHFLLALPVEGEWAVAYSKSPRKDRFQE